MKEFYKERFSTRFLEYFKRKPTRKEIISFMWGVSAGEDKSKRVV